MTTAILDHVVINTRRSMDAAAAAFADLGFTLTPRGEHTLGSINHLMVFDDNYLELLGLPVAGPARRPELLEAPLGLDGVVFKTDDAEASFEVLAAADLAARWPQGQPQPHPRRQHRRLRRRPAAGDARGGRRQHQQRANLHRQAGDQRHPEAKTGAKPPTQEVGHHAHGLIQQEQGG